MIEVPDWQRRIFDAVLRGDRLTVERGIAPSMAERVDRNVQVLVWAAVSGEPVSIVWGSDAEREATMARLAEFERMLGR